jgi:nitroreductase
MSFIENLNWRYATKEFSDKKVSEDVLEKILEAIQFAPSSFGIQPYRIVVVKNSEIKDKLNSQALWEQKQIKTCSHLLVFCADSDIKQRAEDFVALAATSGRKDIADDPDFDYARGAAEFGQKMGAEWAAKQVYIALGFALAACAELKIDSCPMEAADFSAIKQLLGLAEKLEPKVLLPIGYRSENDKHAQDKKIRFSKEDYLL